MIVAEVKKVERVVVTMSKGDAEAVRAWIREDIGFTRMPVAVYDLHEALVKAAE